MPVSGLPGSLELLLGTVLERFTVKTWQIYDEKGGISFKIKFTNMDKEGLPSGLQNACYTKKSASKQTRDQNRHKQYEMNKRVTRSQARGNDSSIELPRQNLSTGESEGHFGSPEQVYDPVSNPAINESPVCSTPLTLDHSNDHSVQLPVSLYNDEGKDLDSECNDHYDVQGCDENGENDISSGDETDRDDPVDSTTTPCHFDGVPGHDNQWRGVRKTCTAPGCGIFLCHGCIAW